MTSRRRRRDEWRQTPKGTWTIALGQRGLRVTLFQNRRGGTFYRSVFQPGTGRHRRSLATRDREEAERLGRALYAALLAGGNLPGPPAVVRLGALAEAFVTESPMFLDNAEHTQADQRTRIAILRAAIGDHRDVRTLSEHDVRQYEARRKAGGIRYGDGGVTGPVRQRSVQADVKLLKQMLRWACSRSMPDGGRWLDLDPLQYARVKGESDVRRPVASYDRFEATRAAMQRFQQRYTDEARTAEGEGARARAESRRISWVRAELGLFLLESTGRRRGAVMGLRWADFDFAARKVTWQAEYDKKNKTWEVAYPESFFESVRDFQRRLGAVGGFLFPRQEDAEQPAPPELLSQWIRKAEEEADLPKLRGSTCHAYRRKWRSERSDLPIKAVAVAGGWTDFDTMLRCYDHPDDAAVLAVTSVTRKRREVASA